jgi:hypothetical protein
MVPVHSVNSNIFLIFLLVWKEGTKQEESFSINFTNLCKRKCYWHCSNISQTDWLKKNRFLWGFKRFCDAWSVSTKLILISDIQDCRFVPIYFVRSGSSISSKFFGFGSWGSERHIFKQKMSSLFNFCITLKVPSHQFRSAWNWYRPL